MLRDAGYLRDQGDIYVRIDVYFVNALPSKVAPSHGRNLGIRLGSIFFAS